MSCFLVTALFINYFKSLTYPILATRPSVLAGEPSVTKDGDAMINDAGKHEVKGEGESCF